MLDKLEKTLDLIAAMKAAVPFEVELTPPLIAQLRAGPDGMDIAPRQVVRDVSFAGDEGGILSTSSRTTAERAHRLAHPPHGSTLSGLRRGHARLPEASGQETEEATRRIGGQNSARQHDCPTPRAFSPPSGWGRPEKNASRPSWPAGRRDPAHTRPLRTP